MTTELSSLSVIFTEFYYWITVVLMFFIHVGFCMYEVGVSRHKNGSIRVFQRRNVSTEST